MLGHDAGIAGHVGSEYPRRLLSALMNRCDGQRTSRSGETAPSGAVAKIAYAFAVGEFGMEAFRPLPQTLDVILDRTTNVSYVVGGDWEVPAPDPQGKHLLVPTARVVPGGALIIVEIRLFPAFETPQYRVVVGEIDFRNPQHAKAFADKLTTAVPQPGD